MAAETAHDFRPTSGRGVGTLGIVGALVVAGYVGYAERSVPGVRIALGAALVAAGVWAVLLRPRASVRDGTLVLRHALSDTHIPLARVEGVRLRSFLQVWADGRRHICTGIGRSTRSQLMGREGGDYGDFVVARISGLSEEARRAAERTPQAAVPPVRRHWAWHAVALVGAPAGALVATLLL